MKLRIMAILAAASCSSAFAGPIAYTYSDPRFNGNGHLLKVDLATGRTTDVAAITPKNIESLCLTPAGTLYGLTYGESDAQLWDLTSPPGRLVGVDTFSGRVRGHPGLAFHQPTGRLWNIQGTPGSPTQPGGYTNLYRMDPATARVDARFVAPGSFNWFCDSIAISPSGVAYGADFADKRVLYQINLTTGAHTAVGAMGLPDRHRLADISFDAAGKLWAIAGAGDIYRIDTPTGAATYVSTIDRPGQFWMSLAVIPTACTADCTADGRLDILDFACFQNAFALGDKAKADCNADGTLDVLDFACFQNQFALGCP